MRVIEESVQIPVAAAGPAAGNHMAAWPHGVVLFSHRTGSSPANPPNPCSAPEPPPARRAPPPLLLSVGARAEIVVGLNRGVVSSVGGEVGLDIVSRAAALLDWAGRRARVAGRARDSAITRFVRRPGGCQLGQGSP